jgi:hypothetical protein
VKIPAIIGILLVGLLAGACDNESSVPDLREQSFMKIYGSETRNEAVDLACYELENEMIILARAFESATTGSRDIMIVKTDMNGNNSSYFFTNSTGRDENPAEMVLNGTDIYIGGTITEGGEQDMMLARFSLVSNTFLWVKDYGEDGKDEAAYSIELQGGEIVLAGVAEDSIDIDNDQDPDVFGQVKNIRIIDTEGTEILESPRKNPGHISDIQRFNANVYHSLSQEIDPVTGEVNVQLDVGLFDGNFGTGYSPQIEGNDFPVNLIRLNSRILALGYMGDRPVNPQESTGTFLLMASYDRNNGNIIPGTASFVNAGFGEIKIIPTKMSQVETNQFLILGTEKAGNVNVIRMIRFEDAGDGTFNILWNLAYGSARDGDRAASVIARSQNEIYFDATIYFQSLSYTKIAMFKTDGDGQLDF